MATATQAGNLFLSPKECSDLLQMLNQAINDKHAELRRTENPTYHEALRQEEARLRNLADKVRQAAAAV